MSATELKRYRIKPGHWPEFLDIWARIVAVRRRHGFGILFAFADREQDMFTWAIDHRGDFAAAANAYYDDPERIELAIVEHHVADYEIRPVDVVPLP